MVWVQIKINRKDDDPLLWDKNDDKPKKKKIPILKKPMKLSLRLKRFLYETKLKEKINSNK